MLGGGSNLVTQDSFVRTGADGEKRPAVMLYSAYNQVGGNGIAGVTIDGDNDAFIAVYASETDVEITGSGDVYGGVVAKRIDMSGSGDIHYDEALATVTLGKEDDSLEPSHMLTWWEVIGD
ncbi:hypothetical protein SAOR_00415 [Salinisphaera orenii MK-B5]|uniref:DUF7305 domain-containing protein n=2 Tax=Salinisphaera TaxID=180541 RepID=A0A423PYA6_9GAMM|nr:hypothetical protein SAOR_00415 [Salinisphaera orenii MK-B5]